MQEVWKPVVDYEKLYKVSNLGKIKNAKTDRIRATFEKKNGYVSTTLWKDGKRTKVYIHRAVARAFIDNPYSFEEVNHKDLNKKNNCASNLEWCSHKENMMHAAKNKKDWKRGKLIKCLETGKIYKSSINAEKETGISSAAIRMNICGKNKSSGGFHWVQLDY